MATYSIPKEVGGVPFVVELDGPRLEKWGAAFWVRIPGHFVNEVSESGYYRCDYKGGVVHFGYHKPKVGGKRIDGVRLPGEAREAADAELARLAAEREARIAGHAEAGPAGFVYIKGCDTSDTYAARWPEGADFDETWEAEKRLGAAELIRRHVLPEEFRQVARETGAEELPADGASYGGYRYGREGYDRLLAVARAREEERRAREEEARRQREERRQAEAEAAKDELLVFSDTPLASAGARMLHSMAASISEKDGVAVYDTADRALIGKGSGSTYDCREQLRAAGFAWDKESRQWRADYTPERATLAVDLLKRHDTKADPRELGLSQCWECGRWVRRVDSDGYCGC